MQHSGRHRSTGTRATRIGVVGMVVAAALAVSTLLAGAAGAASPTTVTTISTAQDGKLGTILVADTTVYTLDLSSAKCTAKCQKVWHPVVLPDGIKKAKAGDGVDAAKLGTVKADGGALQVTYDGDRLYWYAKDTSPGDVKGATSDKFGTGAVVVTKGASGSTDTGSGGVAF